MPRKKLKSDLGWSTVDRIVVRGKDLPNEILGHLNLGDMAFLELTGRVPNAKESKIFNAMVVTLVEHGVTPSAIVARLTYLGAPEALQAAVAGGLLGLGSVFVGSMEEVAKARGITLNATGAIGALACELGLDWKIVRGLGVMARAVGLVGHLLEETRDPMATEIWERVDEESSEHLKK